jgi:hypothetical protein
MWDDNMKWILQKLVAKCEKLIGICQSLKKFAVGWMSVDRDYYFFQLFQLGSLISHVFHLGVTRLFIRE